MVTMTHKSNKYRPKIALYKPDIPQNTASIIRTCSCLGAKLEIIQRCGFLFSDSRFKRVAMDYMDVKEITFYRDEKHFFNSKKKGRLILMTTKAEELYTSFKFEKFDTIIFGRESSGVPERIHEKLNHKLKIPMIENKRSLNLSTSVSIVLGEILRQNNT